MTTPDRLHVVRYDQEFFTEAAASHLTEWVHEQPPEGWQDPLKSLGQVAILEAASPPRVGEVIDAAAGQLEAAEVTPNAALSTMVRPALSSDTEIVGLTQGWGILANSFHLRQHKLTPRTARALLSTVIAPGVIAEAAGCSTRSLVIARYTGMARRVAEDYKAKQAADDALTELPQELEALPPSTDQRPLHLSWMLDVLLSDEPDISRQASPAQAEVILGALGRRHVGWERAWLIRSHNPLESVLRLEEICRGYRPIDVASKVGTNLSGLRSNLKFFFSLLRASLREKDVNNIKRFAASDSEEAAALVVDPPYCFTPGELESTRQRMQLIGSPNKFYYKRLAQQAAQNDQP